MARHEGVSCDSCAIENFKGKRYKCLICYDYDLCELCYEGNLATARHVITHPMQCILTRNDYELYFGGEPTLHFPQSFTCPYCGQKGFTELELTDHFTATHVQMNIEVICPICASSPIGRANIREDFMGHLNLEHRNPSRDLISFFDEAPRHGARRLPVPNTRLNSARGRRSNMSFSTPNNNRETSDPIAEFLTQLSGVRRNQVHPSLPAPTERQIRGRHTDRGTKRTVGVTSQNTAATVADASVTSQPTIVAHDSQLLIPGCLTPRLSENEQIKTEEERADKSLFVSRLILEILNQNLT